MKKSVSIVLVGSAGQGINTIESILSKTLFNAGYHVFSTKEFMSRIRGGMNSTSILASTERIRGYKKSIDILFVLEQGGVEHLRDRVDKDSLILADESLKVGNSFNIKGIAEDIGSSIYENTVCAGVICGILGVDLSFGEKFLADSFAKKGEKIISDNISAFKKGVELGVESGLDFKLDSGVEIRDSVFLSGSDAVAFGAIAGGCNFICSYPMSPSTGVLVNLAKLSGDFDIGVEQVEDEIAAINMSQGVWYAGGRALVTTSGGGFALMGEGVSLCGMIETPCVVHLAQRPGPATGLPTRTEQGDLDLVLYSGHGEYPRLIYAPGDIEECFYMTHNAFNIADKYQVPAFIVTDQYLMDSYYDVEMFSFEKLKVKQYFVKTEKDYGRYVITKNGVSPRGIPGFGSGLVCVDSDEHDEKGHITEDLDLRVNMVDKRLKKMDDMGGDYIAPTILNEDAKECVIVCWGSTKHMVFEAAKKFESLKVIHFSQLHPLNIKDKGLLEGKKLVMVEGNATGQFANHLKRMWNVDFDHKILKYNGLPFSVEELTEKLGKVCRK